MQLDTRGPHAPAKLVSLHPFQALVRVVVVYLLLLFSLVISSGAIGAEFADAQKAASEGRYDEVVIVLTELIDGGGLADGEEVIAYANRGIASSLLKSYVSAKRDLLWAIALDPGHLLTQNHLGIIAEHVDADYEEAVRWYGFAADDGYAPAQSNLASMLRTGLGVSRNLKRAFELYRLAADQEYIMSYAPLGEMYLTGQGTVRDYRAGMQWLQKGAESGVVTAHYSLGQIYEKGTGVERDYESAADEYRSAAMQGHGDSQNALGYLYRRGAGVRQDFVKAAEWYQLASDQGNLGATNRLAWLLATCPVQQVCNGAVAVRLAETAVAASRSATNLDSLAAAHARLGDFEAAIDTVNEIIGLSGANARYASRLRLYRQGRPYQLTSSN